MCKFWNINSCLKIVKPSAWMEFLGKGGKKAVSSIWNVFTLIISFDLHNNHLRWREKVFFFSLTPLWGSKSRHRERLSGLSLSWKGEELRQGTGPLAPRPVLLLSHHTVPPKCICMSTSSDTGPLHKWLFKKRASYLLPVMYISQLHCGNLTCVTSWCIMFPSVFCILLYW